MEEYEYLENLNSEELVKLISEMIDFEETTKVLMILEEKDSQKALELGKDIIKNNKRVMTNSQSRETDDCREQYTFLLFR